MARGVGCRKNFEAAKKREKNRGSGASGRIAPRAFRDASGDTSEPKAAWRKGREVSSRGSKRVVGFHGRKGRLPPEGLQKTSRGSRNQESENFSTVKYRLQSSPRTKIGPQEESESGWGDRSQQKRIIFKKRVARKQPFVTSYL